MGRKRSICRDTLLDAAEAVVRRDGAARATLSAVATEAGVSKSTVLYDCKSKEALMQALIERRIAAEETATHEARATLGAGLDSAIRARIALARREVSEEDRAVMLSLSATIAQNSVLTASIRAHYARIVEEIAETSTTPDGAFLAFLAVEGLHCLERFDILKLDSTRRRQTLDDIAWLAGRIPAETESEGNARCAL